MIFCAQEGAKKKQEENAEKLHLANEAACRKQEEKRQKSRK